MRLERRADALQVLAGERFAAGDAHAHRQGLLPGRQPLRQLAAVAGRKAQNVDAMGADQRADFLRIPLALGSQHHLRTAEQRHQQTLGGGVEVDRIKVQFAVVRRMPKRSITAWQCMAISPWHTTTPFGLPVEPEV